MKQPISTAVVVGLSVWSLCGVSFAADPVAFDEALQEAVTLASRGQAKADPSIRNPYDRGNDWAVVLFDETGASYGPLPQVDEDDRIVVVVVTSDPATKPVSDLRITKCTQGSEVRVTGRAQGGIAGASDRHARIAQPGAYTLALADHCGSEQGLEATFKVRDGNVVPIADKVVPVAVATLPLSRFTVGLGIFFDRAMTSSFSAAAVKGQAVPVIVEDRHLNGLSTAAFVTLRPCKIDTVRKRLKRQMFGPAAGVSLTAPADNLYLAVNFEPLPGFGVLLGYHAVRDQILSNGYAVGDALPAGTPPTGKRWVWWGDSRWRAPLFVGLNLDASLLASIMGAISK